jgi:hypothetical protein
MIGGEIVIRRSCLLTHKFASQGTFDVNLTISGPNPGNYTQRVTIKDHLIVSIGDSYASGEGNPDIPRSGNQPAKWVDTRCHRSAKAGPAQAAMALENSDPHTSVTLLSFACGGARINLEVLAYSNDCPGDPWFTAYEKDAFDPYKPGDPSRNTGSGILGSYRGTDPAVCTNFADKVPSQLSQMAAAVKDRRVDSLVISAGGNDIGFYPLAATCIAADDCLGHYVSGTDTNKYLLPARFGQDRSKMGERYRLLSEGLKNLRQPSGAPVRIAGTYITEYPDPTTDVKNSSGVAPVCDEIAEDLKWNYGMEINNKEATWAHQTVLPALNGEVQAAAGRHGWRFVGGISKAFEGHGYCVGNSDQPNASRWIRTGAESAVMQGPDPDVRETSTGTLHPTEAGHGVYRDKLLEQIRPSLAALPVDGPVVTNARSSLRAINFPTHFVRHQFYLGELTTTPDTLSKQDATFKIVPGLADPNAVSFEAVNFPGWYLRHDGSRVRLAPGPGDLSFKQHATFRVVEGRSNRDFVSFQAYNYPSRYLRHRSYHMYVEPVTDSVSAQDSTFAVVTGLWRG